MRTIWKWIPGFEGRYEVSNKGVIRGVCRTYRRKDGQVMTVRGSIISPSKNKGGYLRVNLNTPEGPSRFKSMLVHRIVALAFLPTDDTTLEVNHKDRNITNCCVDNLEWVNRKENVEHSYSTGRHRGATRVRAVNIETGEVFTYRSIAAATRELVNAEVKHRIAQAVKSNAQAFGFAWSEVS